MPHFHLHMRHGPDRIEDMHGAEYNNLMVARAEAIATARKLIAERLKRGGHADGSRFEIADEGGEILLVLPFCEAFLE